MALGSTGNCYICGAELGKTAMKNHILKAHSGESGGQECSLLKIEGAYDKDYWLFIDIPVEKSLSDVDRFLRKIWLECCGHMSAFRGSGQSEVGKSRKLKTFSAGDKLLHEYDFGTTTETVITFMGFIKRKAQRESVRLLARNSPPPFRCADCGAPAEYICTECMYDSANPFYCVSCGEAHEHDDMLLPVTNSPRMGECGYCGELDTFAFVPSKIRT
ncbi:MAG: hypothetical protein LBL15_07525 [Oscillospiraceae bacterium]|nr:hypothetical protein [Oscillospiraceae bacterium]